MAASSPALGSSAKWWVPTTDGSVSQMPTRPIKGTAKLLEHQFEFRQQTNHGQDAAKPLERQVVFRSWAYKNPSHTGHAAVSVKYGKNKSFYLSLWPRREGFIGILLSFFGQSGKWLDRYSTDKSSLLADKTKKKLRSNLFKPHENQKPIRTIKPGSNTKTNTEDWGVSAEKIYIPLLGPNKQCQEPTFRLFGLNAKLLEDEQQRIKNAGKPRYTLISKNKNCAGKALHLLKVGGSELFVPQQGAFPGLTDVVCRTPNSARAYALKVYDKIDELNRQYDAINGYCRELRDNPALESLIPDSVRAPKNLLIDQQIAAIYTDIANEMPRHPDTTLGQCICRPSSQDNLSVLTKNARGLVDGLFQFLMSKKGMLTEQDVPLLLQTHALIECIKELMEKRVREGSL